MSAHGYYLEDLKVGMSSTYGKTITDADVTMFAGISGDTNPLHLDDEFASRSQFRSRIAHGMLSAGLLSTIFGTKLPGPGAIYMSQNLRFLAPVRIGETVIAKAVIEEIVTEKRRVRFACQCAVGDTLVIAGEALLMVPTRPHH